MSSVVNWEVRGTTGLITINRPKALNALNQAVITELTAILSGPARSETLRAIVLCGAGDRAFVAGADIKEMKEIGPLEAESFAAAGQHVGELIEALPIPVIAAVQGFALGGGCEMAMACDIILAGEKAKFGQPEVNLGVIPGFGGTQRLLRRVGTAIALDLCLTGRTVSAEEALRMGMVSRVVAGDVLEAALATADEIAKKGPTAVRLVKRAIHENADADLRTGLAAERTLFGLCFASPEQAEGMSAFLERRPANFNTLKES